MAFIHKVVGHYNDVFYFKEETFIYNYVSNLKNYHPIYLAREFDNLDLFPISEKDRYNVPCSYPRRYTWRWLKYGISRKYLGNNISNEEIVLKERGVKLIHAHFGPQGYFALKLRGKTGIPIITNFYGYDISELARQPEWVEKYKQLFDAGDLFLVEGEFMRSKLVELGCPENKAKIQRIAIPLDKITYIPRKPKNKGEKVVFIFAGRFVEKKGLIYALQAVNKVREAHNNFEFRIIGDGPLRPQIEEYIKANKLEGYVTLLGFRNYPEYIREMKQADIFVHPSVTAENGDSEGGAPTSILEAQAGGMPVISTEHADIPNIVVPGKSALLSKEKDIYALAKNMIYMLENQKLWEQMGRIGREFVEKYHNIKIEINELERKYAKVIENKGFR
ncbi:MAG: glycosyltransferase [bacterium]|nr:glycosyltransferase [bacterium]MDD5757131.1 glycosyltransferase [bacterium]